MRYELKMTLKEESNVAIVPVHEISIVNCEPLCSPHGWPAFLLAS